jgi:pimeloyl-ACP methyl ester carboxylesterase
MVANYTVTLSFDWPKVVTPGAYPRTMRNEVELIRDLAARVGVGPPYIMVGASMGGKTALMSRTMYADEVVAAIVIDTAPWSTLDDPEAPPTRDYAEKYPSAAARIEAAIASKQRREFDIAGLSADKQVRVHVDVVPNDAPQEVQERSRRRVAETERDFCQVVRHFGAGHSIMVTDPRAIIADIIR